MDFLQIHRVACILDFVPDLLGHAVRGLALALHQPPIETLAMACEAKSCQQVMACAMDEKRSCSKKASDTQAELHLMTMAIALLAAMSALDCQRRFSE